jgi:hypothetical protein
MNRLSAAVNIDDWDKVRENMRAILDVDPAIRRSPLNWNVPDQEQHHFNYDPVGAIEREEEREEEYEGYGIPFVRRIQDVNNDQREEDDGRVSPFVRWRREQIQGVNNEDALGEEPDAWAIASPRRSPIDPHPEEWGMYWDQPAAPHLIEDLQLNWIQQVNVGHYNRSGLPAEDWEREEKRKSRKLIKKLLFGFGCSVFCHLRLCTLLHAFKRIYILLYAYPQQKYTLPQCIK